MKTKFKRLRTRSLIDSRPVVVTLTLIQTGTIQTHDSLFTSDGSTWTDPSAVILRTQAFQLRNVPQDFL